MNKIQRLFTIVFFVTLIYQASFGAMVITKSVNRQAVSLGATLTYTINYSNSGPADLTGVTIWDTVPFRAVYEASTPAGTPAGSVYNWNIGNLANGSSGAVTFSVIVDADMNTITCNIRNTASMISNEEAVVESFPVFTTVIKTYIESDQFVTYGAWEDRFNKRMGYIHIYSLADGTNVNLYDAQTEDTQINNSVLTQAGVNAGTVIDYPSANMPVVYDTADNAYTTEGIETSVIGAPNNVPTSCRYFKLATNKPTLWIFDSPFDDNWSDAFIYVMSTDYKFSGSTFFTHLYYDRNPSYTYHAADGRYGDGIAIHNINNFDVAAYVYRSVDNGATWYFAASSTVKAEDAVSANMSDAGIWFYGGTKQAEEGDAKVILRRLDASGNDMGDANGILFKGNVFAGRNRPSNDTDRDSDHDNNNAFFINKSGNKVSNTGTDLLYGCVNVTDDPGTGRGELVVTNMGATPAMYKLYKYRPDAFAYRDPVRMNLTDDYGSGGKWEQVYSNMGTLALGTVTDGVAAFTTKTYMNASNVTYGESEHYGSFMKIELISGGPIQAVGGANILGAHYGQADYLEAKDTNSAVGREFYFSSADWPGYAGDFWKFNKGGIFVALCPMPNTNISITTGAGFATPATLFNYTTDWGIGQTPSNRTTGATTDRALRLYSIDTGTTYKISSNNPIFLMVQNLKGREKVFSGVSVAAQYFSPNPVLSKSASSPSVWNGSNFTWSMNFFNNGAGSAKNVQIVDTLPAGVTFVSSNPAPSFTAGNLYRWDFATIAPNTSALIRMIVNAAACGENVTNTAITYYEDISGNTQPAVASLESNVTINCIPTPTNTFTITPTYTSTYTYTVTLTPTPTSTLTLTPIIPQFTIAKAAAPGSAGRGETVTYTIHYENTGLIPLVNFQIWDTVPDKIEVTDVSLPGVFTSATGMINWLIPSVATGASGDVTFTGTLKNTASRNEVIGNIASANADAAASAVDSNQANVTANVPLLQLTPVTNYPNPFDGDTTIVFNLSILADNCSIKFYTLSGEPVKTMDFTEMKAPIPGGNLQISKNPEGWTYKVYWNGTNSAGKNLSSGIYIYRIKASAGNEEQKVFSKLAILR